MQQTSISAYRTLKNMGAKQTIVYNVIQNSGPVCNAQIADRLGWEINRVTGRVKELREMKRVEQAFKDKFNGRTVIYWETTPVIKIEPEIISHAVKVGLEF